MGFNVNRLDNFSLLDERLSTPQMSILSRINKNSSYCGYNDVDCFKFFIS